MIDLKASNDFELLIRAAAAADLLLPMTLNMLKDSPLRSSATPTNGVCKLFTTQKAKRQRSAASDGGIPRFLRNWRVNRRGAKLWGTDDRNLARDAAILAVTSMRRVILAPFLPLTSAVSYMMARV